MLPVPDRLVTSEPGDQPSLGGVAVTEKPLVVSFDRFDDWS